MKDYLQDMDSEEEIDSKYMIRRKYYVPKDEQERNYRMKRDNHPTEYGFEDVYE